MTTIEPEYRAVTFTVTAEIRPDEHLSDFLSRWHRAFMDAKQDSPCHVVVSEPVPTPFVVPVFATDEIMVDPANKGEG